MQTSPDLPTTVDFGNNLVNYIEVNPDDVPSTGGKDKSGVPADKGTSQAAQATSAAEAEGGDKSPTYRPVPDPQLYQRKIPAYLCDFDQPEDTQQYHNAVTAIEKLPTPPGLPGFLGKPILNAATLIKDDNSVLIMPNHTVLNHLATSSIKNNILAVSATTRYKNKVRGDNRTLCPLVLYHFFLSCEMLTLFISVRDDHHVQANYRRGGSLRKTLSVAASGLDSGQTFRWIRYGWMGPMAHDERQFRHATEGNFYQYFG